MNYEIKIEVKYYNIEIVLKKLLTTNHYTVLGKTNYLYIIFLLFCIKVNFKPNIYFSRNQF